MRRALRVPCQPPVVVCGPTRPRGRHAASVIVLVAAVYVSRRASGSCTSSVTPVPVPPALICVGGVIRCEHRDAVGHHDRPDLVAEQSRWRRLPDHARTFASTSTAAPRGGRSESDATTWIAACRGRGTMPSRPVRRRGPRSPARRTRPATPALRRSGPRDYGRRPRARCVEAGTCARAGVSSVPLLMVTPSAKVTTGDDHSTLGLEVVGVPVQGHEVGGDEERRQVASARGPGPEEQHTR